MLENCILPLFLLDVCGPKELLTKLRSSKATTIKRMSLKPLNAETHLQKREKDRKLSVKKQTKVVEGKFKFLKPEI